MGVSGRVPGFKNAAVNAAAQMLDESAEQAAVRHADYAVAVKIDFDVIHSHLSPLTLSPQRTQRTRRKTKTCISRQKVSVVRIHSMQDPQ
jgi:hypothetical protein